MRPVFVAVFVTFVSSAVIAESDSPLVPVAVAAAAFSQTDASVATNGLDYFAVWRDDRSSLNEFTPTDLYASRIDGAGNFAEPFGRRIASNVYSARVASNGRGYLIVYDENGDLKSRLIADDGSDAGNPVPLDGAIVSGLASNGSGFFALIGDRSSSDPIGVFLTAEGQREAMTNLPQLYSSVVLSIGRKYAIVDVKWLCDGVTACKARVRLLVIDPKTREVTETLIGPPLSTYTTVNAVTGDGRILIAVMSDGSPDGEKTFAVVTDAAGTPVSSFSTLSTQGTDCYCGYFRPSVLWDGREFLVAWPHHVMSDGRITFSSIVATRLTPDGTTIDASPFPMTTSWSTEFVAATSRFGVVSLTTENRDPDLSNPYSTNLRSSDLYARHAPSIEDLRSLSLGEDVVRAAAIEMDAQIAVSGERAIVAWREYDQPSAVRAALLDGSTGASTPLTVADRSDRDVESVSVAALTNTALVAWSEWNSDGSRILTRPIRFGQSSLAAGASLVRVATNGGGETAVAANGNQFLVVWTEAHDVLGARVSLDGTLIDRDPIRISRDSLPGYRGPRAPHVVWTGKVFLVVWSVDPNNPMIPDYGQNLTIVRAARLTADGAVVDSTDSLYLQNHDGGSVAPRVALVVNGDAVMALWAASEYDEPAPCIYAMAMDTDGNPTSTKPFEFACGNASDDLTVVPRTHGFLAIWSGVEDHEIRSAWIGPDGTATPPSLISAVKTDGLTAANIGSTTLLEYSRIADEPQYGNVARIFQRFIDNSPPRIRAVRH